MKTARSSSALSLCASALVAMIALTGCKGDGFNPESDFNAEDESDAPAADLARSESKSQSASVDESAPARAADVRIPRLADGEDFVGGELVAKLQAGAGSKLYFIGNGKPGAGDERVEVVSSTKPGSLSVAAFPQLADASPLELFNAATPPGTPVPEKIARLYGSEAKLGQQGWMLDAIAAVPENAMITTGYCNNTSFQSAVDSFGYASHLFRLDQVPIVDPNNVWGFYEDCYAIGWNGDCPTFYQYDAHLYEEDRFYGRVAVCQLDYHQNFLDGNTGEIDRAHVGPTIMMASRGPNDANWAVSFAHDVAASEIGNVWAWSGASALNTDREVRVYEAEAYDGFDIGMSWEQL